MGILVVLAATALATATAPALPRVMFVFSRQMGVVGPKSRSVEPSSLSSEIAYRGLRTKAGSDRICPFVIEGAVVGDKLG
jgi:hypothetical protein